MKYRRRRDRAERRLEASEAGLARVHDLLREVSRQIRPLERQAKAAVRHNEIRAELDALGTHLHGREIAELAGRLGALEAQSKEIEVRITQRTTSLEEADRALSAIEDELGVARADELAPIVSPSNNFAERARGYLALVRERRRSAAAIAAALEGAGDVDAEISRVEDEIGSVAAERGRGARRARRGHRCARNTLGARGDSPRAKRARCSGGRAHGHPAAASQRAARTPRVAARGLCAARRGDRRRRRRTRSPRA